jgi:hypothetical protein
VNEESLEVLEQLRKDDMAAQGLALGLGVAEKQ